VGARISVNWITMFSPVKEELILALGAIVPLVIVVFAIILAIRLGHSLFERVTGGDEEDDD
jgi:hypothetical protein